MKQTTNGLIGVGLLLLSIAVGFLLGAEYQRYVDRANSEVQTHIVSVMLYNPPSKRKPPIPKLFKNQRHKLEVDALLDGPSDLYCMAQNIYFEASNQSREGKRAVAVVVMNRVKNKHWPNTVCGVVKQRKQFSWYWDGMSDIPDKTSYAWKQSVEVAREILYGKIAGDIKLNNALHYHADYVNPKWAKKKVVIAKIDDHIFYGR